MRLGIVGMAVALIVSGCATPDDVKKTGVVWQGSVVARYDQLANCLSKQTTLYYKGSLYFDRNAQHATVTFSIPVTGIIVEVYDLRQVSPDVTEVSWSTRLERGRHQTGKPFYLIDTCGASPLPATPPPAVPPAQPAPAPAPSSSPNWAPDPVGGTTGDQ